jgi:hypothetical protein
LTIIFSKTEKCKKVFQTFGQYGIILNTTRKGRITLMNMKDKKKGIVVRGFAQLTEMYHVPGTPRVPTGAPKIIEASPAQHEEHKNPRGTVTHSSHLKSIPTLFADFPILI